MTNFQHTPLLPLKRLAAIRSSNVDKVIENDEIPIRLCNYVDVYYNDQIHPALEFTGGSAKQNEIDRFWARIASAFRSSPVTAPPITTSCCG